MSVSLSNITPVAPIGANDPLSSIGERGKPGEFQKVLEGAINGVESLNSDASDSVQKFLTGETEELHSVALAAERAEVAFVTPAGHGEDSTADQKRGYENRDALL